MPCVTVEGEEVPDYLNCPICFTIPEAEVLQCRDGHVMCKKCYVKLKECPQCRTLLDSSNPIRNRHFEALLDELKVDCCFKSNGCDLVLKRGLMQAHQTNCAFDFKRFGKFLNICSLIGFAGCDFGVNNGNVKNAVEHFVSEHDCILTNTTEIEIALSSFNQRVLKEDQFWTPVIIDLKDKLCYLLIMAVTFHLDDSIAWFVIFLPYPNNANFSKCLVQLEVGFRGEEDFFPQVRYLLDPLTFSRAVHVIPENLPYRVQISSLNCFLKKDGSLNMVWKAFAKQKSKDAMKGKLEHFVCQRIKSRENIQPVQTFTTKTIQKISEKAKTRPKTSKNGKGQRQEAKTSFFLFWLPFAIILGISCCYIISEAEMNSLSKTTQLSSSLSIMKEMQSAVDRLGIQNYNLAEELKKQVNFHKEGLEARMRELSEAEKGGFEEETKFVKKYLLAELAEKGEVETLEEFLKLDSDFDVNFIDVAYGYPPLYLVTKDTNRKRGLEKAKLLVRNGALVRHPDVNSSNLLRFAALGGNKEMFEYFVKEGNFEESGEVTGQDEEGNTALHLAMMNVEEKDSLEIAEVLIGYGARCDVKNKKGVTPLQVGFAMDTNKEKLERMCRMRIEFKQ